MMLCDNIKGISVLTSAVQSFCRSIPKAETGTRAPYRSTQVTGTSPVLPDTIGGSRISMLSFPRGLQYLPKVQETCSMPGFG